MINFIDVLGNEFIPKNIKKKINRQEVEIKTHLSADDYIDVVQTIAESCFDDNGKYHPEYREVAKRYTIIKFFTNIDVENITSTELFKSSQGGTWFNTIESIVLENPLWTEIEIAVDKLIEYKILSRESSFDKMCNAVTELIASIPTDQSQTIADVKEVLHGLEKVDAEKFTDAVIKKYVKET